MSLSRHLPESKLSAEQRVELREQGITQAEFRASLREQGVLLLLAELRADDYLAGGSHEEPLPEGAYLAGGAYLT